MTTTRLHAGKSHLQRNLQSHRWLLKPKVDSCSISAHPCAGHRRPNARGVLVCDSASRGVGAPILAIFFRKPVIDLGLFSGAWRRSPNGVLDFGVSQQTAAWITHQGLGPAILLAKSDSPSVTAARLFLSCNPYDRTGESVFVDPTMFTRLLLLLIHIEPKNSLESKVGDGSAPLVIRRPPCH